MRTRRLVAFAAVPLLIAAGCSGDDAGGADRPATLAALADGYVVPMYEEVATTTAALDESIEALCAAPGADTLAAAQLAMREARGAWLRTETMRVGPDMARRSAEKIDWRIDADRIDALLAADEPELTAEVVGTQMSSTQRGLGAIEYFIDADDALEAVARPRTCAYLEAVATVAADEAAAVLAGWTTADGDTPAFRDRFAGVDDSANADMSLDDLVNEALNLTQRMSELELLAVRGAEGPDSPPPDPIDPALVAAIHEGPAGLGVADDLDRLEGMRVVFVDGLAPLLGDDLEQRVADEIEQATTAFAALGDGPLQVAAVEQTAQVRAAYDAVKALQITLATDVVSKLGVTVGFSDADGDSAG